MFVELTSDDPLEELFDFLNSHSISTQNKLGGMNLARTELIVDITQLTFEPMIEFLEAVSRNFHQQWNLSKFTVIRGSNVEEFLMTTI